MRMMPKTINVDTVETDIQTIREAAIDLVFLSPTVKEIAVPRRDYERLVQSAGNLAAGETFGLGKSDVERLLKEESLLRQVVERLEETHFVQDQSGVDELIAQAQELLPENPQLTQGSFTQE